MAGAPAYSPCVTSADLAGDGEWRLVVATADKKLKTWNGTTLASEHTLLEVPVGIAAFYAEDHNNPASMKAPSLAVAAGCYVYIYRNLRPFYKFTVPNQTVDAAETVTWERLRDGAIAPVEAFETLSELRDQGAKLTSRSLDLLAIEEGEDVQARRDAFAYGNAPEPLTQQTSVTCVGTIKKRSDDAASPYCVYFGTESGQLYVLHSSGTAVRSVFQLPAAPAFVASTGVLEVDYRIVVACRDGKAYTIKNDEMSGVVVEFESQPVGLCLGGKSMIVGCMNDVVHAYTVRGRKEHSIYMPSNILAMEELVIDRARTSRCLIVALGNDELRVYNGKCLVSTCAMSDRVRGMRFGRVGREDNALALTTRGGSVRVKIMPRSAKLEGSSRAGPPAEQDIPLAVPKKTKLYVEQTQRERLNAIDMHRVFQRDLMRLRYETGKAYLKVMKDGTGPSSSGQDGVNIRLNATIQGLGPLFRLNVELKNCGEKPVMEITVLVQSSEVYKIPKPIHRCPVLLPGYTYKIEVMIHCVDPNGGADDVHVYVCRAEGGRPHVNAIVKMPMSEFADEPR